MPNIFSDSNSFNTERQFIQPKKKARIKRNGHHESAELEQKNIPLALNVENISSCPKGLLHALVKIRYHHPCRL